MEESIDLVKKRLNIMGFSLKDGDTKPIYYKKYKNKCKVWTEWFKNYII